MNVDRPWRRRHSESVKRVHGEKQKFFLVKLDDF
jgi:hypothetical protein